MYRILQGMGCIEEGGIVIKSRLYRIMGNADRYDINLLHAQINNKIEDEKGMLFLLSKHSVFRVRLEDLHVDENLDSSFLTHGVFSVLVCTVVGSLFDQ